MRNHKTKEKSVVNAVREGFVDHTWVADKKVENGCSRRRPDLLLDMGSHVIIVEIDENKHNNYDSTCENKRLMELSRDHHHREIVFIRFNPDGYTSHDEKRISSCWKLNKMGVMTISNPKEWKVRIECLKETIRYWIKYPPKKMVHIIELYFE
jgi:hypothetical protein